MTLPLASTGAVAGFAPPRSRPAHAQGDTGHSHQLDKLPPRHARLLTLAHRVPPPSRPPAAPTASHWPTPDGVADQVHSFRRRPPLPSRHAGGPGPCATPTPTLADRLCPSATHWLHLFLAHLRFGGLGGLAGSPAFSEGEGRCLHESQPRTQRHRALGLGEARATWRLAAPKRSAPADSGSPIPLASKG